jgi:RNA-binding protein YlmH
MSKHIEAEGGELLIRSSNGYMAIVPKNMAEFIKEHIKSGNHAVVDNYVKGLKEMKGK